jgi:hypothetical protein
VIDPRVLLADLWEDPPAALERHGPAIPELAAMRGCPQPANHHSEGDVWAHTRLALAAFADLDGAIEAHAGPELRAAGVALRLPPRSLLQAVAVLLHDIGKPACIAGPPGAWTYYGHDRVGAAMARDVLARLDLPGAAAAIGHELDPDAVAWLLTEHLFWLTADVERVGQAAIARRYDPARGGHGEDLQVLSWCDTLGSRGPDGRPHVDLLVRAEQRLADFRERQLRRAGEPAPVLDGRTVMAHLGLSPGPQVGAVLDWLRGRTDDPEEALALLRANAGELVALGLQPGAQGE